MKKERRLILVILAVMIFFSLSIPVFADNYYIQVLSTQRGIYRYNGSSRQEQFTMTVKPMEAHMYVRASWRTSYNLYVCNGAYRYILRGQEGTITSGWADHPTPYTPDKNGYAG